MGVTVLIGSEALRGFGLHIIAQLGILVAAISYSCTAIYGRRFNGIPPVVLATGMLCGTTIMIIPLVLFFEQPWNLNPGWVTLGAVSGLAVISTSLAYIIYFRILSTAGATNLSLVTFLIPPSAILLGVLVLGERPGWNVFGGMLLIFVGLIAIDGRLITRLARK